MWISEWMPATLALSRNWKKTLLSTSHKHITCRSWQENVQVPIKAVLYWMYTIQSISGCWVQSAKTWCRGMFPHLPPVFFSWWSQDVKHFDWVTLLQKTLKIRGSTHECGDTFPKKKCINKPLNMLVCEIN